MSAILSYVASLPDPKDADMRGLDLSEKGLSDAMTLCASVIDMANVSGVDWTVRYCTIMFDIHKGQMPMLTVFPAWKFAAFCAASCELMGEGLRALHHPASTVSRSQSSSRHG